jgi:hypothetical protein
MVISMLRTLTLALVATLVSAGMPSLAQGDQEAAFEAEDTERFVQGFVRFMAYHEAGHLLINQLEGLNSNPEWTKADIEAYADQFAVVLMEPDPGDEDGIDEIISASLGWLQVNKPDVQDGPHAPPQERAMDIICLMYGSDPQGFSEFQQYTVPEDNCQARYKDIENQVETIFRNHSEDQGYQIEITFEPPATGMERAHGFLEDTGIVYDLKDDIEADFFLTDRTTIQVINCKGRVDPYQFYFDTVRGQTVDDDNFVITICYELIDKRLKRGTQVPD